MSLVAQSMLGRLPIDISQVGVMGEMFARFKEQAEWCSCLKTSGSRVCDLILGPVDDRVHLVTLLEEAIGQLQLIQDEH
jgi:hypothetical protein